MEDGSANLLVFSNDDGVSTSLSGARAQDLGPIGGLIGGSIGVMAVVGAEGAQGW